MNDKPNTPSADSEAPLRFDNLKQYLSRIRDELVVRNHLAGMDVKEAVDGVAKEIDKLSAKVSRDFSEATASVAGEARVQGHLALMEMKDRMGVLEDVVRKGLQGAAKSPAFLSDTARLHLAFARMDAEQAVEEKVKELRRDSHKLNTESAALLKDLEFKLERLAAEAAKYV